MDFSKKSISGPLPTHNGVWIVVLVVFCSKNACFFPQRYGYRLKKLQRNDWELPQTLQIPLFIVRRGMQLFSLGKPYLFRGDYVKYR